MHVVFQAFGGSEEGPPFFPWIDNILLWTPAIPEDIVKWERLQILRQVIQSWIPKSFGETFKKVQNEQEVVLVRRIKNSRLFLGNLIMNNMHQKYKK